MPVTIPEMPVYMVWHARRQDDAVHRWLREQLLEVVDTLAVPAVWTRRPAKARPAG
ncbi:MAG TPA: hypothetical protein PKJ45_14095 [Rubrivivax sp.]|nr:hypothetical protein [Rubrivivax sp.]